VEISIKDDETLDDLLHGELKLIQHKKGYRYSVDALLLSHFALPLVDGRAVLDMGTGAGVVALILAQRAKPARVVGVEIQNGLAGLAERNAQINPTEPRVEVIRADATQLSQEFEPGSFSVIVTNPPFRELQSGNMSPNLEKAIARHEIAMSIKNWLYEAGKLVAESGSISMVYPVDEGLRLMKTIENLGLHLARRQYATDRPRGDIKLLLLDLRKKPCQLENLPDVPIQTDQGKFSLDGYK
jgi:tRNA1Val (adenine37-N6)-methyltransferase